MPTVLIADDEVDHRELLTFALHRLGYDVVTAADATAALALLAGGGIDAALIDVRMPGISGIELCRRIRSSPETELLPVMVISADVHRHQIMTALHAGADDFLAKPFSRAELTSRLEALLRTRPSAAARSAAAARAAMLATRHALLDDRRPPRQQQQPVRYLNIA
ncbi:response regulator [Actinoplanes sp. NEAU-A12]|uniref:Response regulator n=1 Tax=Actinoplanes sandaracinus TaxID=3045177 RepID=A0ABT6WL94_9ACTN|nr:response regulator [Actinoplanes sandaracinus]MDI6100502.1 response regulator [Actinoplanes sandaracinus]